jgi:hypothetical protein
VGVGWVLGTARWRRPENVVITAVADLNLPQPLALAWRKDNKSPLLAGFVVDVRRFIPRVEPEVAGWGSRERSAGIS